LALVVGGFALIAFAYDGVAQLDVVSAQVPYLVSGGLGGLGLVLTGMILLVIEEVRRRGEQVAAQLERLTEELAAGIAVGPTSVPDDAERVMATASTYHRPDCRLIAAQEGLHVMAVDAARSAGLTACRICDPAALAS
jgi:hypothetical protein